MTQCIYCLQDYVELYIYSDDGEVGVCNACWNAEILKEMTVYDATTR